MSEAIAQTQENPSIEDLHQNASAEINSATNIDAIENVRIKYLGKSGLITSQLKTLGSLPPEERKTFGAEVNKIKNQVASLIDSKKQTLEEDALQEKLKAEAIDVTIPTAKTSEGSIHPISQVTDEIIEIFSRMGLLLLKGLKLRMIIVISLH